MRSDLKKLDPFTLETSKNHLIRNFLRNGRVRVKVRIFFNFDKSASSAIPIFNEETSKWELICPIGDCNMDIEKNEENGEEILKFRVSVHAATSESTIFGIEEVGPLFIGPISGILRATCVYKSVIRKG